ncbi:conserved hypothetical protein [Stenotrophomonas geniculata]|uniref:hypothetical protein n=1 Tax=Stenotrophomonas geniculata TaxID=86188 RepID=UPI00374B5A8A
MAAKARLMIPGVLLLTVTAMLLGCGRGDEAKDIHSTHEEAAAIGSVATEPRPDAALVANSSSLGSLPATALQQYYACKADSGSCSKDPLVADSPEEAQWLLARGYPTPDQVTNSLSSSADSLKLAAEKSGALVDKSLYGHALLREGRYREAVGSMVDSFIQGGNIYGLYLASDAYMHSGELLNPPLALAYLRLAYLAGDSKAGIALEMEAPQLSAPERASIDRRAAELRNQLSPTGSWPRP